MQNYEFHVDLRYKLIGIEKHSHVFLLASVQESNSNEKAQLGRKSIYVFM